MKIRAILLILCFAAAFATIFLEFLWPLWYMNYRGSDSDISLTEALTTRVLLETVAFYLIFLAIALLIVWIRQRQSNKDRDEEE